MAPDICYDYEFTQALLAAGKPGDPWSQALARVAANEAMGQANASDRDIVHINVDTGALINSFTLPIGNYVDGFHQLNNINHLTTDGAGTIWWIVYDGFFDSGSELWRRDPDGTTTMLRQFVGGSGSWLFGTNVAWNPNDSMLYTAVRGNPVDGVNIHQIDPTTGASTQIATAASSTGIYFADLAVITPDNALWFNIWGDEPYVFRYDITTGELDSARVAAGEGTNPLVAMSDNSVLWTSNTDVPNLRRATFSAGAIVIEEWDEPDFYYTPVGGSDVRNLTASSIGADWDTGALLLSDQELWWIERSIVPCDPCLKYPSVGMLIVWPSPC